MEYCPSCGSKDIEKVDANTFYCGECDTTFTTKKGKTQPAPKGKFDQLVKKQKELDERLGKVEGDLKTEDDGWL